MTLTEAQAMSPEEKRVKMAELMGFTITKEKGRMTIVQLRGQFIGKKAGHDKHARTLCVTEYIPDYCNDLNAVAQVEKTLTDAQYGRYSVDLWAVANGDNIRQESHPIRLERAFLSASADQRTTALILTLSNQ